MGKYLEIPYEVPMPLSWEEQKILFEETKKGNTFARDELILTNLRLVINIANKKFNNTRFDINDIIDVGVEGLIKSVDTFNLEKGNKFNTYAATVVTNEILMFLRKNKYLRIEVSLDSPDIHISENDDVSLDQLLPSNSNREYLECEQQESSIEIIEILKNLSEREYIIACLSFGFNQDKRIYSQKEIASILNLSQSYVSRILKDTIKKLKKNIILKEAYVSYQEMQNTSYQEPIWCLTKTLNN